MGEQAQTGEQLMGEVTARKHMRTRSPVVWNIVREQDGENTVVRAVFLEHRKEVK